MSVSDSFHSMHAKQTPSYSLQSRNLYFATSAENLCGCNACGGGADSGGGGGVY